MRIDVRIFHKRRCAPPVIAGVGIGLALSRFTRCHQRVMLGVLVVAAPLTILSGYLAPVKSMVHAMEVLGRAAVIHDRLAAS